MDITDVSEEFVELRFRGGAASGLYFFFLAQEDIARLCTASRTALRTTECPPDNGGKEARM